VSGTTGHSVVGAIVDVALGQGLDTSAQDVVGALLVSIARSDGGSVTDPTSSTARGDEFSDSDPTPVIKALIVTSDTWVLVQHGDVQEVASVASLKAGQRIDAVYTQFLSDAGLPLAGFSRAIRIVIAD
jgi:hypothetical protein